MSRPQGRQGNGGRYWPWRPAPSTVETDCHSWATALVGRVSVQARAAGGRLTFWLANWTRARADACGALCSQRSEPRNWPWVAWAIMLLGSATQWLFWWQWRAPWPSSETIVEKNHSRLMMDIGVQHFIKYCEMSWKTTQKIFLWNLMVNVVWCIVKQSTTWNTKYFNKLTNWHCPSIYWHCQQLDMVPRFKIFTGNISWNIFCYAIRSLISIASCAIKT